MSESKEGPIEKLMQCRNSILFIELAGLLHDIGKLSAAFLQYRKEWQNDPQGYFNDPHDNYYLDHEVVAFKKFIPPDFETKIPINILGEPDFSIVRAVHFHVNPAADMKVTRMLKAADGIDAAIDRNNPLWSAEQKIDIYHSNVFGYEKDRAVDIPEQEAARQKLYQKLGQYLPRYYSTYNHKDRDAILESIKQAFELGLSDTTRPQNDTTLWEHSYAVASILKCLTVHNLFITEGKPIYDFKDIRFALLGIGWDGMRFISFGQKIGDIVGRKNIINEIKSDIKHLIEYEYPVGNEIYSDDNGIYFIVPTELNCGELAEVWQCLENKINKTAAKISLGELQPQIDIYNGEEEKQKGTWTLTSLVTVIQRLEKKRKYPFDSSLKGFQHFADKLREGLKDHKSVCPVCRFRPVQSEDKKKKICETCAERRRKSGAQRDKDNTTVFIDEIKDKNKRAALIVARFGLNDWINGKMIRSLFVTEANGIESEIAYLGNVKQFEKEEKEIKTWFENHGGARYDYSRIKEDIDSLYLKRDEERGKYTRFLYDRRVIKNATGYSLFGDIKKDDTQAIWEKLEGEAKAENPGIEIYNVLNAKTPTPSTILDVWDSTTEYFIDVQNHIINSTLPETNRLCLILEETVEQGWGGVIEAEITTTGKKEKVEILYVEKNKIEIVGKCFTPKESDETWRNRKIKILDGVNRGNELTIKKCASGQTFKPYRTITISPNLFLAIVPADRALEITKNMYDMYIFRFGKVMGRLPFSIGNIFFKREMPMFVVLDSAKRMIANFDHLAIKDNVKTFEAMEDSSALPSRRNIKIKGKLGELDRRVSLILPSKLGNCEEDYYHPYFVISDVTRDRKTFFETVAGKIVHFSEIKKNDKLQLYLNYYDFEFLDSNARRYGITADAASGRRKSNVGLFCSKPYLLDELSQKIIPLWKNLLQGGGLAGMTDTKLRNLLSLWLTKYQEWQVSLEEKSQTNYQQWINIVTSSVKKEFPHINSDQWLLIRETLDNGIFFDTLELYLGIMKERIEKKKEEIND